MTKRTTDVFIPPRCYTVLKHTGFVKFCFSRLSTCFSSEFHFEVGFEVRRHVKFAMALKESVASETKT